MVKKLIVGLLAMALMFCITGCATEKKSDEGLENSVIDNSENSENNDEPVVNNGNKIKGEIEFGTEYTNGLAFVKINGDNKNYCIDKKGNIIFDLTNIIFNADDFQYVHSAVTTGFYNDITLISDSLRTKYITICDKTGKLTTAEELGVSYFLEDAFTDGYIITVTEGEKMSDDKIGVLNHALEWVVEPSSDIVKSLGMDYGVSHSTRFYYDYILYGIEGSVNIRTGELSQENFRTKGKNIKAAVSEHWTAKDDGYYDSNGQLVIDITNSSELSSTGFPTVAIDGAKFVKGKSPIVFVNGRELHQFSLIDTEGNLQFQPVNFGENIDYIETDGNYILVVGKQSNRKTTARLYDMNGNLMGELDPSVILINSQVSLQDGVVRVSFGLSKVDSEGNIDSISWARYFGTDMQPLF